MKQAEDPIAFDEMGPPRMDRATVWNREEGRPLWTDSCDRESHCRLTALAVAPASEGTPPAPPLPSLFVCHDRLGMTALLSFHWTLFGGNHDDRIRHLCICRRATPPLPQLHPLAGGHRSSFLPPSLCSPLPPRKRALRAAFYEIVNLSSFSSSVCV